MRAILSFINWIPKILNLLWGKFFGVIAGFFVWLFPAIKSFFSRKIATGRFFATFASLPFVKNALVFFLCQHCRCFCKYLFNTSRYLLEN